MLRNLSEPEVGKVLFDSFKTAINALTIQESRHHANRGPDSPARHAPVPHRAAPVPRRQEIRLQQDRRRSPFRTALSCRSPLSSKSAPDVSAFAKNYLAVGFKLDYVKADGDLSNYTPGLHRADHRRHRLDRRDQGTEELDLPQKMARLQAVVRGCDGRQPTKRQAHSTASSSSIRRASRHIPRTDLAGLRPELHGIPRS